jgi:hypothetical protein
MPEDDRTAGVGKSGEHAVPESQGTAAPMPPNDPTTKDTKPISDDSAKKKIEDFETRLRRAEKWMIGLTGAIAVFALGGVIVGLFQWNVMSGQLEIMSGQLEQVRDQSNWEHMATRTQRPVLMQRLRLPNELPNQNDFKAAVELENVGSTPSIDLVESTQIWIADSEKPTSAMWMECPKVGVLMKSETVSCETASLSATPYEIQAYQRRTSRLYIRVYAVYWDDIERDWRHQQSMCLFHTFGEPLNYFNYCASGNAIWHDPIDFIKDKDKQRKKENPPRPPNAPN